MALADILADHPDRESFDFAELHRATQAASEAAIIAMAGADSELGRDPVEMATCIRKCIDAADVCAVTAKLLARPAPRGHAWQKLVSACAAICAETAEECGQHQHVSTLRCAEACRECEKACQQLIAVSQPGA